MKLYIFLFTPLLPDIVPYMFFVSVSANCVDPIALRPKLSAPQLLFNFRYTFENLSRCDTFHNLTDSAPTEVGYRLKQKMNMVCICPDFDENNLITRAYLQTYLLQNGIDLLCENDSSILGRTDQMIQHYRNIVLFVDKGTHA